MPDHIWDQAELTSHFLADNGLTHLSDRIAGLRNLRMLDLGHNSLTALPDGIGELSALTDFLYLHDNKLSGLPSAIANLVGLR